MKPTVNPSSSDLTTIVQSGGAARRIRRGWSLALAALVLGAAGWFGWTQRAQARNAAPTFVTTPLERGDINLTITATGNLEPTNEITVGSELSGTILEVYVDTNDRVTKGQPLAKLDTSKLAQQTESSRATLKSAQAKVAQAQATLKESQATLTRLLELQRVSGGKVPARADLDAAQATADRAAADMASAEAAVAEAEAQVRINESDLAKAIIKSPIDGLVLTRSIDPGQTVAASFSAPELFVIAEKLEHMQLKVAVAEADIARVAVGQAATFTVDAWPDRVYAANVLKVSYGSQTTDNVVTYEVELEVANGDLSLRPGMTATADVQVAASNNVYLVPTAALRFDPAASLATTTTDGATKRSFVQSLTPMPPRPSNRSTQNSATDDEKAAAAPGTGRIWVLRDGQPQPLVVKTGLSDGRYTEISGDELAETLPVVLRTNGSAT